MTKFQFILPFEIAAEIMGFKHVLETWDFSWIIIESQTFLWGVVWENSFVTIFENPGVGMDVFILLFFAFSVLSTVWLAEMTVFSKILQKK